jgi:hypothetical protein
MPGSISLEAQPNQRMRRGPQNERFGDGRLDRAGRVILGVRQTKERRSGFTETHRAGDRFGGHRRMVDHAISVTTTLNVGVRRGKRRSQ